MKRDELAALVGDYNDQALLADGFEAASTPSAT
jgi:hypothetical protein